MVVAHRETSSHHSSLLGLLPRLMSHTSYPFWGRLQSLLSAQLRDPRGPCRFRECESWSTIKLSPFAAYLYPNLPPLGGIPNTLTPPSWLGVTLHDLCPMKQLSNWEANYTYVSLLASRKKIRIVPILFLSARMPVTRRGKLREDQHDVRWLLFGPAQGAWWHVSISGPQSRACAGPRKKPAWPAKSPWARAACP
jgi:hypothetical protein